MRRGEKGGGGAQEKIEKLNRERGGGGAELTETTPQYTYNTVLHTAVHYNTLHNATRRSRILYTLYTTAPYTSVQF